MGETATIIAFDNMSSKHSEDHENARLLVGILIQIPVLDVEPGKVATNIVIVRISRTSMDSGALGGLLKGQGLLVGTVDPQTIRLLTHLDVSRDQIHEAAQTFKHVLENAVMRR